MGPDLLEGDVELTEFEALDVKSIKGVKKGANGFPILLMKGLPAPAAKADVAAHAPFTGDHAHDHPAFDGPDGDGDGVHGHQHTHDGDNDHHHEHAGARKSAMELAVKAVTRGKIDEGPDVDLGRQIMALLGRAIANEASEIAAGAFGETCDVDLLNCAAGLINRWIRRESSAGQDDYDDWDGVEAVMDSAASDPAVKALLDDLVAKAKMSSAAINDLPDSAFAYIEPGGEKDSGGKTTPRSKRHFPVHDKAHADNAAARIAQGAEFGDKALPKVKAAQKKFGSDSDDASKGADVAEGEGTVDTGTAEGTGGLSKAVEDALTKALEPIQAELKKELESLRALKAKVEATPVPGGPVMSVTRPARAEDTEGWAAKAARYDELARTIANPSAADGYRKLAADARAKITT